MKRTKPGARKRTITLNEVQWAAVRFAIEKTLKDGGGPLALLWMSGPYKKLHKMLLKASNNIASQYRRKP